MKAVTQTRSMTKPLAKSWNRAVTLLPRILLGGVVLVGAFYLVGGIGAIIYVGKTSPEVQASIQQMEPGPIRSIVDFVL